MGASRSALGAGSTSPQNVLRMYSCAGLISLWESGRRTASMLNACPSNGLTAKWSGASLLTVSVDESVESGA